MTDLAPLLSPRSVAVIGASPDQGILRGRIMRVLCRHGFSGSIWPVSRSHDTIMGHAAYPTIGDVPEPVELAVLIIPAAHVPAALRDCAGAGVKAALILASGFAEEPAGPGQDLQAEIRSIAAETGMAVAGPNSEGLANLGTGLCATFSPALDSDPGCLIPEVGLPGRIAVIAQSGGMGFAFFDRGRRKGLRFSHIVTTGNEACIESLDVVEHLLDRDEADVFLLFMEDVKTPAMFARVTDKALLLGKPLIVAKIGRSDAAARAAASHTASLAGSHEIYQAMFRRYGVVEGRDTEEVVDIAAAFASFGSRPPAGRRVGIFTGSGGGGGWLADACADAGLDVPLLDPETRATIDVHLPPYGTSQNPVDGTAGVIRQLGYARITRMMAASPAIDAILLVTSAVNPHSLQAEADALSSLAATTAKPVMFWSYTLPHPDATETLVRAGLPLFTNMRNAAAALSALERYGRQRRRRLDAPAADIAVLPASVVRRLSGPARTLPEVEALSVLDLSGFTVPTGGLAASAEEAVEYAAALDGPVALKIQSPDIPHKSAAGGVALGLASPEDVRRNFRLILERVAHTHPRADIRGVLVQSMAQSGLEMIIGIENRSGFGPMVLAGFGGTGVEAERDAVLVPAPLDRDEAGDALRRLRGAVRIDPDRHDIPALCELIRQLSCFASAAAPYVAEIDLNPVLVHAPGSGVSIADALIVTHAQQ